MNIVIYIILGIFLLGIISLALFSIEYNSNNEISRIETQKEYRRFSTQNLSIKNDFVIDKIKSCKMVDRNGNTIMELKTLETDERN